MWKELTAGGSQSLLAAVVRLSCFLWNVKLRLLDTIQASQLKLNLREAAKTVFLYRFIPNIAQDLVI